MTQDPVEGGSDPGPDRPRTLDDEPAPLYRDTAPDVLAPIDESSPVSGHVPASGTKTSIADSPEHDWSHARDLIRLAFRPVGTQGLELESIDRDRLAAHSMQSHAQPLIDTGPAGLPVVYTIPAGGFDIVVNGDHLLASGIEPAELQDAAMRNLATWSATAPWSEEASGQRHIISSDTGDGTDAVRIILPDAMAYLERELGSGNRMLIGIPERHLLTAAALRPDDAEFASLFAEFVVEQSGGADEPIDRRVFELIDGRLVEFDGGGAG